MRRVATVLLLALLTNCLAAAAESEDTYITAGKETSVRILDTALPAMPFQAWLEGLVGTHHAIAWEVNDCGEQTGTAADLTRDLPICAEAQARISDQGVLHVRLGVGTIQQGVTAERGLWAIYIERGDGHVEWFRTLRDLERAVRP